MKQTLLETVRKFLFETPEMAETRPNDPYLLMKVRNIDVDKHLSTNPIHKESTHTITQIPLDSNVDQYAKISSERKPIFMIESTKSSLPALPDKVGATVTNMVKDVPEKQTDDIKRVYDHMLNTNDYIKTDSVHYPGGRQTWVKNLIPSYEQEGKHIYLHQNGKVSKIDSNYVNQHEDEIWNSRTAHVIVSKHPLL